MHTCPCTANANPQARRSAQAGVPPISINEKEINTKKASRLSAFQTTVLVKYYLSQFIQHNGGNLTT
jgi:hypothetical protein